MNHSLHFFDASRISPSREWNPTSVTTPVQSPLFIDFTDVQSSGCSRVRGVMRNITDLPEEYLCSDPNDVYNSLNTVPGGEKKD